MIILSRLQVRDFRSLRSVDLRFPRQASILVEGLNEAGKSSLFEAVYFALYGEPLVAEESGQRGRLRYDSAINYRAERAAVILTLDVEGTILEVARTLRRGQAIQAHLSVARPGSGTEAVTGARPVTERVIQELGKLDNETLLNSCFVEQKKLAKLEDLTPAARRESLEHLLNLDKMQALYEEFRVSAQDKAAVQVLQDRLSLARAQARVPSLEHELDGVRRRLVAVAMHEAFARIAEHEATSAELLQREAVIVADKARVAGLRRRIAAIERARDGVRTLQTARVELDRATREITSLNARIARLDRRAQDDLPRLEARLEALSGLIADVEERERLAQARRENEQATRAAEDELAQIDAHAATARRLTTEITALGAEVEQAVAAIAADEAAAQDAMAGLAVRRDGLDGLRQLFQQKAEIARQERAAREAATTTREQIAARERLLSDLRAQEDVIISAASSLITAEAGFGQAGQALAGIEEARALAQWLQGKRDLAALAGHQSSAQGTAQGVADAQRALADLEVALARSRRQAAATALGGGVAVASGVIFLLLGLVPLAALPLLGGLLAGGLAGRRMASILGRRQAPQRALDQARAAQVQAEATRAAAQHLGGGDARVVDAEAALRDLGLGAPPDEAAAEARVADLRRSRPPDLASARAGLADARAALDEARRQHVGAQARGDALREQVAAHAGSRLSPADLEQREIATAHLAHQRAGLEGQIAGAAEQWGLAPSEDAVAPALSGVQEEIARARDVRAAVPARRDAVATKKAARDARQQVLGEERTWLGAHNWGTVTATIAGLAGEADTLASAHAAQDAGTAEQARALGVPPEMAALQQAHGAVTQDREHLLGDLAGRPQLLAQRDADQQAVEEQQRQGQAAWHALLPLPEDIVAEEDLPAQEGLAAAETELGRRLDALDEHAVDQRQRDLDQQHGTIQADLAAARRAIADKHQEVARLLAKEVPLRPPGSPLSRSANGDPGPPQGGQGLLADSPAAVGAVFPIFGQVTAHDRLPLEERQSTLFVDLEATRRQRDDLATTLNLRGTQLDQATCADELATHQRDLGVRGRAERIIRGVRERLVEKVLPNTERNMSLLLPLLTLDRYRDCQLTADYKLQIWDEMAGRYVGKSIFSGGTRDQFSLALRLAFALATLPEELGTTPGFIFLDEPLSSFDGPRTEALINLLTTGQIAANFAQIFVISHNLMFERAAFTHHLKLADGQVIEHDFDRVLAGTR